MSSESVGANEFPDIAGVKAAKPDANPLLGDVSGHISLPACRFAS